MKTFSRLPKNWTDAIATYLDPNTCGKLDDFIQKEEQKYVVYPPSRERWTAFELTPIEDVRVVVVGQDPYHGPGQAHGLSFSVKPDVALPPSLKNIYKEIEQVFGSKPANGDLRPWAQQGVFLLNTCLSVREGEAGSHQKRGWEHVTDGVLKAINAKCPHVVFLLWGSHAQQKKELIDTKKHLVLTAPHPSPLSAHRGFLGCGHFSTTNRWLNDKGLKPITWF